MILGVESSCDDTGLAVLDFNRNQFMYEKTSSQVDLHALYGGVVPQLAAREHLRNFPVLLEDLTRNIPLGSISKVAVTCGPGLPGSLALGIAFARSLALVLGIPIAGVHHLRGHILSPFIQNISFRADDIFPHLSLLVSGGNTLLSSVDEHLNIKIIAMTIDDAAGEAIDKGAKLLGLQYPGGPEIERFAVTGDAKKFKFPQAFLQANEMSFSFSGLKTSLRYMLEKISDEQLKESFCDICAGYQFAIVDILAKKLEQALLGGRFKSIGLSGGVSNNKILREKVLKLGERYKIPAYLPEAKYTGDNASMIAFAARSDEIHAISEIDFRPNWKL